ncbi:hypothetical protein LTS17_011643 [Exophiala oligosperma]
MPATDFEVANGATTMTAASAFFDTLGGATIQQFSRRWQKRKEVSGNPFEDIGFDLYLEKQWQPS